MVAIVDYKTGARIRKRGIGSRGRKEESADRVSPFSLAGRRDGVEFEERFWDWVLMIAIVATRSKNDQIIFDMLTKINPQKCSAIILKTISKIENGRRENGSTGSEKRTVDPRISLGGGGGEMGFGGPDWPPKMGRFWVRGRVFERVRGRVEDRQNPGFYGPAGRAGPGKMTRFS